MDTTKRLNKLLQKTADTAKKWRHEFVTPEHFLYVLTRDEVFQDCYALNGGDAEELRRQLSDLCTGEHHATTTPVKNV